MNYEQICYKYNLDPQELQDYFGGRNEAHRAIEMFNNRTAGDIRRDSQGTINVVGKYFERAIDKIISYF